MGGLDPVLHLLWVKRGLMEVQGKQIQKPPRTETESAGVRFLLDVIELVQRSKTRSELCCSGLYLREIKAAIYSLGAISELYCVSRLCYQQLTLLTSCIWFIPHFYPPFQNTANSKPYGNQQLSVNLTRQQQETLTGSESYKPDHADRFANTFAKLQCQHNFIFWRQVLSWRALASSLGLASWCFLSTLYSKGMSLRCFPSSHHTWAKCTAWNWFSFWQ